MYKSTDGTIKLHGKQLLPNGLLKYIFTKLNPSDTYDFPSFQFGYKNLQDFYRHLNMSFRFYSVSWKKIKNSVEELNASIGTLQKFEYTVKRGEERTHNNKLSLLISKGKKFAKNKKN